MPEETKPNPQSDPKLQALQTLDALQDIQAPGMLSDAPDPETEVGVEYLELQRLEIQNDRLREQVNTLKQNNSERKKYAKYVFLMIVFWLFAVLAVLVIQATASKVDTTTKFAGKLGVEITSVSKHGFQVPDTIILALIGSSTLNVIGLFVIVVKYLFPEPSKEN